MSIYKRFFWVLPFACCAFGYYVFAMCMAPGALKTPVIVGQHLLDAVAQLSAQDLNIRIVAQKEDPDVPVGTILKQVPHPGRHIKPHQSLFVTVAKAPKKVCAPNFVGSTEKQARSQACDNLVRLKTFYIESSQPKKTVIAQWPEAGTSLDERLVVVYLSAGQTPFRVFPDMRGSSVKDAQEYFKQIGVTVRYSATSGTSVPDAVIKEHKPLAGSIIDLSKPVTVHISF